MPSKTESSFGARLANAQKLRDFIANFPGYQPPRAAETVEELTRLLDDIGAANAAETNQRQQYNGIVTKRAIVFREGQTGVMKLLPPIRGAVQAQYGKESVQYSQVATLATKLRTGRLIRKAATETTPESTYSQSEKSYGSSTQYFKNLVETLTTFPDYNPSNPGIQLPTLQTFCGELDVLNSSANTALQQLRDRKIARQKLYEELAERVDRIKAYVKAQYGQQSKEYLLVRGLKV